MHPKGSVFSFIFTEKFAIIYCLLQAGFAQATIYFIAQDNRGIIDKHIAKCLILVLAFLFYIVLI